jgi:3-hydroxyacyl-CoA dehydrogenase
MKKIKSIAVIGSGTMGNSFAQLFGSKDIKVNLIDTNSEILDKASMFISYKTFKNILNFIRNVE